MLTWISAKTKTQYDDIFIKRIRWQIALIIVTFGFQVGTVRLSLLEVLTKIKITRLYTVIYVIAVTMIIWHLLDILVDWYQNEVQPQKPEPRQVDTILLLLHRFARILLITISLITLLSLYNVSVNALVAALGVGGLALSLAAQDTLSNVISGIMIMVDQPFRVGYNFELEYV